MYGKWKDLLLGRILSRARYFIAISEWIDLYESGYYLFWCRCFSICMFSSNALSHSFHIACFYLSAYEVIIGMRLHRVLFRAMATFYSKFHEHIFICRFENKKRISWNLCRLLSTVVYCLHLRPHNSQSTYWNSHLICTYNGNIFVCFSFDSSSSSSCLVKSAKSERL